MRWHFYWLACFVFCLSAGSSRALPAPSQGPPVVTVESGTLQGIHFGAAANEVAFFGVPYAAPPVGELRWKPPQSAKKWDGIRQATQFGAACPQRPASWLPYIGWSEDCLYLNVWTTQLSADEKLPVIVYFHGGSNKVGYSQATPLGPVFSRMGVVVVSANYRLGPFGFLAHPALTAESEHHSSGDYGLLDQLQSLRWVRENISRFGGNPDQVTVMGQSSGAADICLLMSSPLAAGLFQRAIMQSGDCQSVVNEDIRVPEPYNSISTTGESAGERLAHDFGVADSPDMLRKLRSLPAQQILEVSANDPRAHFDAIVDGWIVPDQPAKIFAEGKQIHIPVLVGSNANEATVFVNPGDPKTVDQYKRYLQEDTGKHSNEEFQAYPVASDAQVPAQYLRLQDDFFAYGAASMAQAMARSGQNAYLYYFTYAAAGKRSRLGAYHGEELLFLRDSFPADWQHAPEDKKLGEEMRVYWTQFAKTGDPNSPGLPNWAVYKGHERFELGRAVGVRPIAPRLEVLEGIMKKIFAETFELRASAGKS